jgi:hypothetical protein
MMMSVTPYAGDKEDANDNGAHHGRRGGRQRVEFAPFHYVIAGGFDVA